MNPIEELTEEKQECFYYILGMLLFHKNRTLDKCKLTVQEVIKTMSYSDIRLLERMSVMALSAPDYFDEEK